MLIEQPEQVRLSRQVVAEYPRDVAAGDATQARLIGLEHFACGLIKADVVSVLGEL